MVSGKPNLTLGGSAGTGTSPSKQRRARAGGREGESFASYLPPAGLETQSKSAPAQIPAGNTRQAARERESAPAAANTPPSRDAVTQGMPKRYLGFLPDNYATGSANDFQTNGAPTRSANLPAGNSPRSEARALAQPGSKDMSAFTGNMGGVQLQRISSKSGIRLSGQPVTGRGGIGMVDTRKTAPGNTALQSKGGKVYAAPNANAAQGAQRGGNIAPPGSDAFASYSAYYGGQSAPQGQQSFVEFGFSSQNAALALQKLGYEVRREAPVRTVAKRLDAGDDEAGQTAGFTFGSTRAPRFATGDDGARTAILTASHRRKGSAQQGASLTSTFQDMAEQGLGSLAAKFESGADGIAAIGYDSKGGTSYGKYQIASRVGTMSAFLDYLREKAPDIAKRLEAAGPANTGGRNGRMPAEWRRIAEEDPARFESLQSDFIRTSHFEPAMQAISAATGVAFESMPAALQEVLFSTAVQHGPTGATRIVSQALQKIDAEKLQGSTAQITQNIKKIGQQLITQIYNLRAGQFTSSTSGVQAAVRNRLKQEMREALDMLTT